MSIPEYLLIEVLGILLDNATEAVENKKSDKLVKLAILQNENTYSIKIANAANYVSYEEIDSWFELGKSSKGDARGIGLYRVKQICSENDCNLLICNILQENINWIEFTFNVKTGQG